MRVFVAVAIDGDLRAEAAALRRRLPAGPLRWVPPENLHLTLKFLGEIPEARVADVAGAVRDVARRMGGFEIRLRGLGAFPSPLRAEVLWVGIQEGAEQLKDLAGGLESALAAAGFPKEAKPFRPHLTLARTKGTRRGENLTTVLAELSAVDVGRQPVAALQVIESRLRPTGAVYRLIQEAPLRGHPPSS